MKRILDSVSQFINIETTSGIALLIAAIMAIFLANSGWSDTYFHIVHFNLGFQIGQNIIEHSFVHWVNDGLMVLFFFVVGLEIKRELLVGTLNHPKKAALPIVAAFGGAALPALIYYSFNPTGEAAGGWGIPMATDIAFAVGLLVLFGKSIPSSLKIFLLALAIIDDLIAIGVIALYYTTTLHCDALIGAGTLFGLTHFCKKAGIMRYSIYWILGIGAWIFLLKSGIHPTITGVILGLMTPIQLPFTKESPLETLIHQLHPWVAFVIMPLFAFLNAGVSFEISLVKEAIHQPITQGILLGLIIGKPVGVFTATYFFAKLKLVKLPEDVSRGQLAGVGFLTGIGFTMALFISNLALTSESLETFSKIGILLGSSISAIIGMILLKLCTLRKQ